MEQQLQRRRSLPFELEIARMRQSKSHFRGAQRLSVPGAGLVLATVTEERATHVRESVRRLLPHLNDEAGDFEYSTLFRSRWFSEEMPAAPPGSDRRNSAWALVSTWLVGRLLGVFSDRADFQESESWFLGALHRQLPSLAAQIPPNVARDSLEALRRVPCDEGTAELLPYILDVHGPGSRLSVMREPGTLAARSAKRRDGVFYTPADVAEFMADAVLDPIIGAKQFPKCIDPACGSGVFLRALLRSAELRTITGHFDRFAFARYCLYGLDISVSAIEAACFLLLHDTFRDLSASCDAPWAAWHLLRLNFAVADALAVIPTGRVDHTLASAKNDLSAALANPSRASDWRQFAREVQTQESSGLELFDAPNSRLTLADLFPEVTAGFDIVIGNPPYSSLGKNRRNAGLVQRFVSFPARPTGAEEIYTAFVEMMWRFAGDGESASALVVPLSLAYNRGKQLTTCRRAIMRDAGEWRFAFFDREPHALFGEDVKTRNTIVLRTSKGGPLASHGGSCIWTGPLHRWTSRSRAKLFSGLRYTPLGNVNIGHGVPKLSGLLQCEAMKILTARASSFSKSWVAIRSSTPALACVDVSAPTVFVASTAYNFLNVFRPHCKLPVLSAPLSENKVFRLDYSSESEAAIAFAILGSRLAFWWWHVHGDGFHVPRWFLDELPFEISSFRNEDRIKLADFGNQLWRHLQEYQIVSLNKGKASIAYRPLACELERDVIDSILIKACDIRPEFCEELRNFVRDLVTVDHSDHRRQRVSLHFANAGSADEPDNR